MNDIKEIMAKVFYQSDYFYAGDTNKTAWVDGGNSIRQDEARQFVEKQIQLLTDAGFVFVPKEPNNDMIAAGIFASQNAYKFNEIYEHMIEASQCGDV